MTHYRTSETDIEGQDEQGRSLHKTWCGQVVVFKEARRATPEHGHPTDPGYVDCDPCRAAVDAATVPGEGVK